MSLLFDNMEYAILYVVIMNILGVAVMGIDKYKAQHKLWRIPEKTLFLVSILGGSIGTWAGMYLFRHKTKHWYFCLWHAGNSGNTDCCFMHFTVPVK